MAHQHCTGVNAEFFQVLLNGNVLIYARAFADCLEKRRAKRLGPYLQAVEAGATSLWEVMMYPRPGVVGMPLFVVVPGFELISAPA